MGPPGSGKTTVLAALHGALANDDVTHAAFEVEAVAWAHPEPSDDQSFRHVAALRALHVAAGRELLLCAATVTSAAYMRGLLAALEADERLVIALDAPAALLRRRIVEREPPSWSGLPRLLDAAGEIADSSRSLQGVDATFSTEDADPAQVAAAIRALRPELLGGA